MCLESFAPGGTLSLPFALGMVVLSTCAVVKYTEETPTDPMHLYLKWPWEE